MRVEAVITCVDYGDFLAYTLPANRQIFDYLVVVTSPADKLTRKLCEHWNCHCCVTDAFHADGGFSKGKGINAGLDVLTKGGWVVHLDADILLPPLTRSILEQADLDPKSVYGCDRFMVPSWEAWIDFVGAPSVQHECGVYVHPRPFPIGARIMSRDYDGYVPIGFFQLWNPSGSKVFRYPDEHTDAGRGDMLFAKQWPRARRGFLPELIAYHLDSGSTAMGQNWKGRKTPRFGPRPTALDALLIDTGIPVPEPCPYDGAAE